MTPPARRLLSLAAAALLAAPAALPAADGAAVIHGHARAKNHVLALEEHKHFSGMKNFNEGVHTERSAEGQKMLRDAIGWRERLKAAVSGGAAGKTFSMGGAEAKVASVAPGAPLPEIREEHYPHRQLFAGIVWRGRDPVLTLEGGRAVSLRDLPAADLLSLAQAAGALSTEADRYGAALLFGYEGEAQAARKCAEGAGAGGAAAIALIEKMEGARRTYESWRRQIEAERGRNAERRAAEAKEIPKEEWLRGLPCPEDLRGLFNASEVAHGEDGAVRITYRFDRQREYKDFLEKDGFSVSGEGEIRDGCLFGSPQVQSLDSPRRSGLFLNAVFLDGEASLEAEMKEGMIAGKFRPRPKELGTLPGEWRIYGYDWWWNSGGYEFGNPRTAGKAVRFAIEKGGTMRTFVDGKEVASEKAKPNALAKVEAVGGRITLGFGPGGRFAVDTLTFTGRLDPEWIERARAHGKAPNVNGARWTMLDNSGTADFWEAWNACGGALSLYPWGVEQAGEGIRGEGKDAGRARKSGVESLRGVRANLESLPEGIRRFASRGDFPEWARKAALEKIPDVERLAASPSWEVVDAVEKGAGEEALPGLETLAAEIKTVRFALGEIFWKAIQEAQDW